MIPISQIITVASCGFVLGFGSAGYAQTKPSPSEERGSLKQGDQIIKGEVVRLKGDHLFVKRNNGKEVHMHIDQTTKMSDKKLEQGELIEAIVDTENHVLSIHSTDRRSDHLFESGPAVPGP